MIEDNSLISIKEMYSDYKSCSILIVFDGDVNLQYAN
jgi:predicted RNA-binding protein with PIN domain